MHIPLLKPSPVWLSRSTEALKTIERSGHFTTFGPVNAQFEAEVVTRIFGDVGACMTVSNATLGLMLAIRDAIGENRGRRRYALMPSFTFAATAQAALWNGLTPLFCDIDENDSAPSAAAEEALLERYGDQVAVIVPMPHSATALTLSATAA